MTPSFTTTTPSHSMDQQWNIPNHNTGFGFLEIKEMDRYNQLPRSLWEMTMNKPRPPSRTILLSGSSNAKPRSTTSPDLPYKFSHQTITSHHHPPSHRPHSTRKPSPETTPPKTHQNKTIPPINSHSPSHPPPLHHPSPHLSPFHTSLHTITPSQTTATHIPHVVVTSPFP